MKNALLVITCSTLLFGATNLWSQDDPAKVYSYENVIAQTQHQPAEDVASATKTADQLTVDVRKHEKNTAFYEIIVISIIALISLVSVLGFLVRSPSHSASDLVHATGLIFIVYGTVFLSMTATTDQQLTAPMGILGAVAGYLFGQLRTGRT